MMNISTQFSNSECCRACHSNNTIMQTISQFEKPVRALPAEHVLYQLVNNKMVYCFDFFHDLIGNIKTIISYLLNFYDLNDIQQLNEAINQTHFETGKIKITDKKLIKSTSGAQIIEFFIKFSYLNHVNINVNHFKLYSLLRRFYNIHSKFVIYDTELKEAHQISKNLIMLCIKLDIRIKPKLHNTIHYKDFVLNYGPVIRHSTLRFERKHVEMLNEVRSSLNNKNLPLSIINW